MKYVKLNTLCDINIGKTPSRSNQEYWGLGGKWISIADIKSTYITDTKEQITPLGIDQSKIKLVPKDTVIMSFKLTVGKVAITAEDMYTNEAIASFPIKDDSKLYTKYLYYCLQTLNLMPATDRAVMGATLNKAKLNEIKIPYVDYDQQIKIANILDQAQELIDKRKAQIEALDELIQSVFYDMFGDPGLNSKGWETGRISDIIVKTQYGTSTKANETEGEYAVLRMNNITYSGNWDFKSLKYVDLDEKDRKKYLVYKGEVLFNRTNSKELVGKTAVYKREEPMAYAGYLVKATPNNRANGQFIASYMNTKYTKSLLFNMAKNIVGMANINAEEFKNIKVYIPPIEIQNQFAEIVENIEKQKALLNESLVDLENNFNSLMQRAFSGELF
ncbi:MAG: restriction endonuclease subunit S [Turicibacter sp.]|nr:restriction endonuclease subunit S [Turicibacter sp.]